MMKPDEPDNKAVQAVVTALEASRISAPDGFVRQVMAGLPERAPAARRRSRLAAGADAGRWWLPALAGAAAMALLMLGAGLWPAPTPSAAGITVTFELHAPDAASVELAGSFNDWAPGGMVLHGPDATGYWRAEMVLPPGRHEYLFLVDGREWVTDPQALLYRPDGFGHDNAVLEL